MDGVLVFGCIVAFLATSLLPWLLHRRMRLVWALSITAMVSVMYALMIEAGGGGRAPIAAALMVPLLVVGSWRMCRLFEARGVFPGDRGGT